jgi:hypothetical protein
MPSSHIARILSHHIFDVILMDVHNVKKLFIINDIILNDPNNNGKFGLKYIYFPYCPQEGRRGKDWKHLCSNSTEKNRSF